MKLFWKIFFVTMLTSAACLALGGYLLIRANTHALLNNEAEMAREYGDIVYASLANEMAAAVAFPVLLEEEGTPGDTLGHVAASLHILRQDHRIAFALVDAQGEELWSSLETPLDKDLLGTLSPGEQGWMVKRTEEGVWLQALRPVVYEDMPFYLETQRDVGYIFQGQQEQYETLLILLLGMLGLVGVLVSGISRMLTERIVSLSAVTGEMAGGDLTQRVPESGGDELAALSRSFNHMADQLEEKVSALQEEARRKERFVGAFTHEIKTPLTAIIGYGDLLRRQTLPGETQRLCADYIVTEGKRLENLSLRLMELLVLGREDLALVPSAVEALVERVCAAQAPQYGERGITLSWQAEQAQIPMEPDLMETVLLNLLDNSRKAIDGPGAISVTGRRGEVGYILSLQDTGKGMDSRELEHIREAFYRVEPSRSRREGGAGLGLAICETILTRHGFSMAFQSAPGAGTTVTITMQEGGEEHGPQ